MKTPYKLILFFFLFTIALSSQTEESSLADLKRKVAESESDSAFVAHKIALIKYVLNRDIDTTRVLVNEVLTDLENIDNSTSPFYYSKRVEAINYLAIVDAKQSFAEKALSNYLKALEMAEKIEDSIVLGFTIHNLGMFYRRQKEYNKAKVYLKKAIAIKEAIYQDSDDIALSYNMLGVTHFYKKEFDSALTRYSKAKQLYKTKLGKTKVNGNLALLYYSSKQYDKAINTFQENAEIFKELGILSELSITYQNLAASYNGLKNYHNAILILDSAIALSKRIKHKERLVQQYASRSSAHSNNGNYELALRDYKMHKAYYDSINDIDRAKRITALELNYQFEKEKLQSDLALQNEKTKQRWYLVLLLLSVLSALIIFWLIRKNTRQRLDLSNERLQNERLEKETTRRELELKESELKNESLSNQVKHEFQEQIAVQLQEIIKLNDDHAKTKAIKSLLASLKSTTTKNTVSTNLSAFIEKVSPEFKIKLSTDFSFLNDKEIKYLYLMKMGLSNYEIKDVLNTTLASVKSTRYRIRKKLKVDSDQDIIQYIEQYSNNDIA
ncbi:tetratricopeptide repeat protein [Aquimarina brevivitae]|uniref:tetratricopeptide repeat protein n=1 Tax=Aquimarina brevivitae TaxID=323412 RepID=UPI0013EE9E6A|nr:tetratricopeptide repeat protein [Aquimarina brevivitae]